MTSILEDVEARHYEPVNLHCVFVSMIFAQIFLQLLLLLSLLLLLFLLLLLLHGKLVA